VALSRGILFLLDYAMFLIDAIISRYMSRQVLQVHSLKDVDTSVPLDVPVLFDDAFWYRGDGGTELACWVIEPGQWKVSVDKVEPRRSENSRDWQTYQAPPLADGTRLWVAIERADMADPPPKLRGTILLLHGWKDSVLERQNLRGLAALLASEGYRVVMPDLRGHGLSRGEYISFGLHERYDMKSLLDELEARYPDGRAYGIIGHSYGGNVAMITAAIDERIHAAVLVSSPHDLREILPVSVKRFQPRLAWLVSRKAMDEGLRKANKRTGLDYFSSSASRAIQMTDKPVLLIHGGRDITIPIISSELILQARPENTETLFFPDESHAGLFASQLETIHRQCVEFFKTHLE
jgi:uncharacterized protein